MGAEDGTPGRRGKWMPWFETPGTFEAPGAAVQTDADGLIRPRVSSPDLPALAFEFRPSSSDRRFPAAD